MAKYCRTSLDIPEGKNRSYTEACETETDKGLEHAYPRGLKFWAQSQYMFKIFKKCRTKRDSKHSHGITGRELPV